jgi:hypothetical protein
MKTKTYPEIGFLRLRDVIGDGNHPGEPVVPGRGGSPRGRYPKPVKLGERMSACRLGTVVTWKYSFYTYYTLRQADLI